MSKFYKFFMFLFCIGILSSCAKETLQEDEIVPPAGYEVLNFQVTSDGTKTIITGAGSTKTVEWVKGDVIDIFWTPVADESGQTTATATVSGTSTQFRAVVPEGVTDFYAAYPAGVASFSEGTVTIAMPSEVDGAFSSSNLMAAKLSRTETSIFRSVAGLLKFEVTSADATAIRIVSRDDELKPSLRGNLPVTFDADGNMTVGDFTKGKTETKMNFTGAGIYYMPVLADYEVVEGFDVEYYKNNVLTASLAVDFNFQLGRSYIADFGVIDDKVTPEIHHEYYVTPSGAGAKDGSSWSNAFGIDEFKEIITRSTDETSEIAKPKEDALRNALFRMEGGTYDFGSEVELGFSNHCKKYINFTFEGGYYNGSKDVQNHPTIISGNNEHCIFILSRYTDLAIIDCNIENSYGNGGGKAAIRLESKYSKIQLTRCNFNNNKNNYTAGGLNISYGTASLTDCAFSGNTASTSAAINIDNGVDGRIDQTGAVSISGCTFDGNTASSGDGGAMRIKSGGPVSVTGCTFINNTTTEGYGAVMYVENAEETISFTDCVFGTEGNGNISANSGGVARFSNGSAAAKFDNCTFAYNEGKYGGAISLSDSFTGYVTINGGSIFKCSTIFDGSDRQGGAIRQDGGNLIADGLKIDGCTSAYGGAYDAEGGTAQFKNCEFGKTSRNTATLRGGCIYSNNAAVTEETHTFTDCWISGQVNSDGTEVTGGGARVGGGASPTFTRCTFDNCTADGTNGAAGAFWIAGSSHPVFDSCTFSNCSNSGTEKNGGAFAVSSSTGHPYFSKCKFSNCVSSYRGGAFYSESTYTAESMNFDNCEFTLCFAPDEGAAVELISTKAVTYELNNCNFHDNTSPWGALASRNTKTTITININGGEFKNNEGRDNDGWQNGAALFPVENSLLYVSGVKFEGNIANNGPAIDLRDKTTVVHCDNCQFINNEAKSAGGVFYAQESNTKLYCNNSIFDGNQANEGALFNIASGKNSPTAYFNSCVIRNNHWGKTYGSLIPMRKDITGVDIAFNNCTFIRNYINSGVSLSSNYQTTWFNLNSFSGSLLFSNSTIWGRTYQGIDKEGNTGKEQYGFIRVSSSDNKTLKLVNSIIGNSHGSGKAFTINGTPTISAKYCLFSSDYNQSGGATWDESGTIHDVLARSDNYGGYQGFSELAAADYVKITSLKSGGAAKDFVKQATTDINQAIEEANSSFYTWLDSIGALGKDCRGYTRNSAANWPGAYDNDASE